MVNLETLIYFIPMALILAIYLLRYAKKQQKSRSIMGEAVKTGLTEPASLHPVIDQALCIGCGSCVTACPEQSKHVLGLIDNKSQLINPTNCIGHGACKTACPTDAITLVFGTEKRGLDIPYVSPTYETNVPGIYIAGELGGMGLIRNAIEQGSRALEYVSKIEGIGKGEGLDVVVVGAGPAGFAASLGAMHHKLRFVTVEQDSLGGTIFNFPRGKLVMTAPVDLPLYGKVKLRETSKESLLELWEDIVEKTGLQINCMERVEKITRDDQGLLQVKTSKNNYQTRAVILCIGRRGTPRKLGVPGEELPKVVYRLIDPEQYRDQNILVVGGGDSALEAALSIAEAPGSIVTLSYRSESFSRAKEKNREKVRLAAASGDMQVLMKSNVKEITEDRVIIDHEGEMLDIPNNGIIVCAGGILPTPFLKEIGIEVETKHGTA